MKKLVNYLLMMMFFIPVILYGQEPVEGGVVSPEFSRVGRAGWQFLKIPTDARTAAIGGITTVISRGDASSSLANPASIADVNNLEVAFSNMKYVAETMYTSGSIVKNLGSLGIIGVNYVYLDYGDIYRTENQRVLSGDGIPTGKINQILDAGIFSGNNFSLGLCYARQVTNDMQIGMNFRYNSETLDDVDGISSAGWTMDIGTVYYTGINTLRIAMLGRNFGPDTKFVEWDDRIARPPVNVRTPMIFALGIAYDFFEEEENPHLLTTALEFTHPNDGPEKLHAGMEYSYLNLLKLRGGYRFNYDEIGMTLGAGLNVSTSSYDIGFSYAFISIGRLGDLHMFSIGLGMD